MNSPSEWMRQAIQLAIENVGNGRGGPFGALVVSNGLVIGSGANAVTATNDPTAHAEVVAIRAACHTLGSFQLEGCEMYTSCEPCPMCLGAMYWARIARFYFGCSREDAAVAGFNDAHIYRELKHIPQIREIPGTQILQDQAQEAFRIWRVTENRTLY